MPHTRFLINVPRYDVHSAESAHQPRRMAQGDFVTYDAYMRLFWYAKSLESALEKNQQDAPETATQGKTLR